MSFKSNVTVLITVMTAWKVPNQVTYLLIFVQHAVFRKSNLLTIIFSLFFFANDKLAAHQYSTSSSDSSTLKRIAIENGESMAAATTSAASAATMRRPSKWKSSLVYFMDPCIEDCTFANVKFNAQHIYYKLNSPYNQ